MAEEMQVPDPVGAVALLDDVNRRRLYELVAARRAPISKDVAAAALGISRELAAFHLDRLVAGGLLETEYRRVNGRTGPGAGRPAKLYRRTEREVVVSLPARHYDRAAAFFATALAGQDGTSGVDAVAAVARDEGAIVGVDARREAGARPGHRRLRSALLNVLNGAGFEPEVDPALGVVRLRNCPYRALTADHRDLTCGMNLAWARGVADGLADPKLDAVLDPTPGYCCVVFDEAPDETRAIAPAR
jgi:predicted ArsR family transcriptional regulator